MNDSAFMLLQATAMVIVLGLVAMICTRDLTDRRIPNVLVLAGFVTALAFHGLAPAGGGLFDRHTPGGLGAGTALAGGAIAFGLFLVMHIGRVMGAGDVKLMGFAGTVFGSPAIVDLLLLVLISGGALALARLIDADRRRRTVANLRLIVAARLLPVGGGPAPTFDPRSDTADRLPYALAIGCGLVLLAASQFYGIALPWSLR